MRCPFLVVLDILGMHVSRYIVGIYMLILLLLPKSDYYRTAMMDIIRSIHTIFNN